MEEIKSKGYIVAPIGITEKQLLIYQKLYEKCDFRDMTVKYTISQLSSDIKSINIPEKTIYKNVQTLIKKGYLSVVSKASKGNAPTYKITKLVNFEGEPKVNQERTKEEPNTSKFNRYNEPQESQRRTKGEPKGHPIIEIEKDNNILCESIDEIVGLYPGRKTKAIRDKKLPGLIKKYGSKQVKRCVQRYSNECIGKDKKFILNESTFWNGRYEDYLDENYQEEIIKKTIDEELDDIC